MNDKCWYLRTMDETFGPETKECLIEWARKGRIQPGQEVSDDNEIWHRVEDVPFLDMRFSIDIGDGNPRGPFNRAAAEALLASGRLPHTATMVETRAPFEENAAKDEVRPPSSAVPVPPAEEAPVERVVEKIVEKVVEVPVEKIVEVEKVVVDETRVKELEGLLEVERRHAAELQSRLDESSRAASERESALKTEVSERQAEVARLGADISAKGLEVAKLEAAVRDSVDRENKYVEQVKHLEDELRRLPQAASEVADIQAAMYGVMTEEAAELARVIETEHVEFENLHRLHQERADRLLERRRRILKRAGANIEDMTRKALVERPEDPRTAQLRRELDDLTRASKAREADYEGRIRELTERLRDRKAEATRSAEAAKDSAQLQAEVQALREQLQLREKELITERQKFEALRQQQAQSQHMLMTRLAELESPSIGDSRSLSTNQSREAKQVKLASWMRLKR